MNKNYKTPILFLIYNRTDVTNVVFEQIKNVKPEKLFIAADGPKKNVKGDKEKCIAARKVIDGIDWDCEVKTLFREENLGCRKAVSTGIDWFFDQVEQGIILEDDCLPNRSFFIFCEELLNYYKNDDRIMHVSGTNKSINFDSSHSYFFSKYVQIWGWATWKRAWLKYDSMMQNWSEVKKQFKNYISNNYERKIRSKHFQNTYTKRIDSWGYIWHYSILINNGLCIIPKNNMIKNIGFDKDATHTTNNNDILKYVELEEITKKINHPPYIIFNNKFEDIHRFKGMKIKMYIAKILKIFKSKIEK